MKLRKGELVLQYIKYEMGSFLKKIKNERFIYVWSTIKYMGDKMYDKTTTAKKKYVRPSIQVRIRREVEKLVREASDKTGYTADTIRNISVLLGLKELVPILLNHPNWNSVLRMYEELLEINAARLENIGKEK